MPPKTKTITEPKTPKRVAPVVVPEPEPELEEQGDKKGVTIDIILDELAKAKELQSQIGKLIQTTTAMVKRLTKTMQPKKKRTRKPQAQPSGFARPGPITHELSIFLDMPKGEPVARTTVTKQMSAYIKDKGLQNPERKREIILDDKLAKLFKMKVSDTIEYFEIQRLLKNHYIKVVA